MEGKRFRRFGRGQNNNALLPVRVSHFSNTVSCWYCDFKTSILNRPLFHFGRRHTRCLRIWFSVGMGFSLSALVGVILILLWELGGALHLHNVNDHFSSLLNGSLFGFSSSISGSIISLPDILYIFLSSIVSVFIHEVGHALAAASNLSGDGESKEKPNKLVLCLEPYWTVGLYSFLTMEGTTYLQSSEGIQMEYIAVFLAVLFPGALVAFNYELLQALPQNAALRIYCAGIWHNAAFCVVCSFLLFILPLILEPFYIYGESPMVLNVSPKSPLAGYLAPNDVIISLDGTRIHTVQEWEESLALLNMQMLKSFGNSSDFKSPLAIRGRTGYCVPSNLIKGSMQIQTQSKGNSTTCPSVLFAFTSVPCVDSQKLDNVTVEDNHLRGRGIIHCLDPKDVIKLKKCVNDDDGSSCPCSEGESCFSPVQTPGLSWVEITYSSPPSCWKYGSNLLPGHKPFDSGEMNCTSSFTYIGDLITLGHALHLTSYLPRWSIYLGASLPSVLEKLFVCTFHVSLTLALLNSLPVYFLDGECILDLILQHSSFLRPRASRRALQWILVGGTFISILVFIRTFILIW